MENLATTSDHPLETAARAVTAGLSTELVTVLATIAVSATYGGVIGAGRSLLLAHAVGAGLGVAVAWGAAERAQARWSLRAALLVGTLLAPLAPLGARYANDVADTHDVILATQGARPAGADSVLTT